jgi:hypothetical protein
MYQRKRTAGLGTRPTLGRKTENRAATFNNATSELEELKVRLLRELLNAAPLNMHGVLGQAANQAASIAWATPYPLLVLPELVNEISRKARHQAAKQQNILARSQSILSLAV